MFVLLRTIEMLNRVGGQGRCQCLREEVLLTEMLLSGGRKGWYTVCVVADNPDV